MPAGEYRWITVVSPHNDNGIDLLLEPDAHQAAKDYQKAIFSDGIPATMFGVSSVEDEYNRLTNLGVSFTMKPTKMGEMTIAVFDDTCGNLIQLIER
ncbi:hypothetical protein JOC54_000312 [Alkalihalobacillus xiaoxiensis]|uniref:VOC domain-containing protein n=1 Tax=Shouchella xiaoxiensis TaxID=766895 RepID=A0ABS2SNI5_9BACI|nr:hypothetical protein [Shouchella xiaoxiensis]